MDANKTIITIIESVKNRKKDNLLFKQSNELDIIVSVKEANGQIP